MKEKKVMEEGKELASIIISVFLMAHVNSAASAIRKDMMALEVPATKG